MEVLGTAEEYSMFDLSCTWYSVEHMIGTIH